MDNHIELKLDFSAKKIEQQLIRLGSREIPFALALTATRTAQRAQEAIKQEISRVFDRPTPWILNSTYVLAASKKDPQAMVYAREWGGTPAPITLTPQIEGGQRSYKRSEGHLRNAGYLPNGWQVAPGPGVRKDKYGNISRGQIQQILSGLRAHHDPQQNMKKGKSSEYFVIRPGQRSSLQPGVWLRVGGRPTLILTFIKPPSYQQRLDWHGVAQRAGGANLINELTRAVDDILSKAFDR
ncbi:Uncharacterised protein [Yersinia aldovae]|uniref:hypothetical protein n=1 Tax=Yersinia aldovae TaxID=29483 RepID=UPI0005DF36B5|nr:hypothetical protein [Yersinia aldovae]CNK29575.1 Uncharacterised protein [Yersinia aldovae]